MAYLVRVGRRAERDLSHLFSEINALQSDAARAWYEGLKQAIHTLRENPNRCPVIRSRDQLRHLLYGHKPHVYRVIYRVNEGKQLVEVLHVRHGARRELKEMDLG